MAGPSATGNYARAGAAVGNEAANLFAITAKNSPDMAGLVQAAAKRNADKQEAAYAIKSQLLQKGITETTKTANYKQGIEAEAAYKSSKRKAGILATAGGYLGKGIGGLGDSGRELREVGASDSLYDGRINTTQGNLDDINQQIEDVKTNGIPDLIV